MPKSATREMHYLERELHELLRKDWSVLDFLDAASLDGLWYWNVEKPDEEWLSPKFWRVLGYDPATKKHRSSEWQGLIFPEDRKLALANFKAHCENPDHPYDQLVRYRHANGSTVWVRCRGLAIRNAEGKAIRMLGAHNEVTSLKRAEAELREQARALRKANAELARLATRDGLTDLYNRRAFDDHLEWSLADVIRTGEPLSMVLLDLDDFKQINDTLGHPEGDAVLEAVAAELQASVRGNDFPARYGGEEFSVIFPRTDREASLVVAEKFRAGIGRERPGRPRVTASIGISTLTVDTNAEGNAVKPLAERMLVEADRALFTAKRSGGNRVRHYADLPRAGGAAG